MCVKLSLTDLILKSALMISLLSERNFVTALPPSRELVPDELGGILPILGVGVIRCSTAPE